MREALATFKRSGAPLDSFGRCWDAAVERVILPHDTDDRREWVAVIEWSKPFYAAAWFRAGTCEWTLELSDCAYLDTSVRVYRSQVER